MIDLKQFMRKTKKKTTVSIMAVGDNLELSGYIDSEPNGTVVKKHKYFRKGRQLYGCEGNLVRPIQISKVLGLVCLHDDGKYFTREYYPNAFKTARRVR